MSNTQVQSRELFGGEEVSNQEASERRKLLSWLACLQDSSDEIERNVQDAWHEKCGEIDEAEQTESKELEKKSEEEMMKLRERVERVAETITPFERIRVRGLKALVKDLSSQSRHYEAHYAATELKTLQSREHFIRQGEARQQLDRLSGLMKEKQDIRAKSMRERAELEKTRIKERLKEDVHRLAVRSRVVRDNATHAFKLREQTPAVALSSSHHAEQLAATFFDTTGPCSSVPFYIERSNQKQQALRRRQSKKRQQPQQPQQPQQAWQKGEGVRVARADPKEVQERRSKDLVQLTGLMEVQNGRAIGGSYSLYTVLVHYAVRAGHRWDIPLAPRTLLPLLPLLPLYHPLLSSPLFSTPLLSTPLLPPPSSLLPPIKYLHHNPMLYTLTVHTLTEHTRQ
jgi:hypothetical protein